MSPKRPVEKLIILCSKTLIADLLDVIRRYGESTIDSCHQYYKQLPKSLCESSLQAVLDVVAITSLEKWICFCILGRSCQKFESRKISSKFHEKFANQLINLRYLDLTEVRLEDGKLIELIERNRQLKSLTIPFLATDDLLKVIGQLKNLKYLDISGESRFTLNGLKYLTNTNLAVLNIGVSLTPTICSSDGNDVIANIIMQLPNLTEIRSYSYTGRALLQLKRAYISKLKSITDSFTTNLNMKAIVGTCPFLERLTLKNPENVAFQMLPNLMRLKELKVIKLLEGTMEFVITELSLESVQVQNLYLELTDFCATIENIRLKTCKLSNPGNGRISFEHLQSIELIDCDIPNKEVVIMLMKTCAKLKRLAISKELGLTDFDIEMLCRDKYLKNLEELWLSIAQHLTSDSVIALMNHCDNLRLIGTLNGWNMEKVEVNYLKCVMFFTNTMLNLLYFSSF